MLTRTYKELEMSEQPEKAHIVSHLAELMDKRKLSIRRVTEGTGLNEATVRRWYNDKVGRIDPTATFRLCKFLDCTMDDLFTIAEDE